MVIESYIGYFDDPSFDYYGGDFNGNIPYRQSPFMPFAHDLFRILWEKQRTGEYEARRLDWGAIGAKMTKEQLFSFLNSYGFLSHDSIKDYLQTLEDDRIYVLVAFESAGYEDD